MRWYPVTPTGGPSWGFRLAISFIVSITREEEQREDGDTYDFEQGGGDAHAEGRARAAVADGQQQDEEREEAGGNREPLRGTPHQRRLPQQSGGTMRHCPLPRRS